MCFVSEVVPPRTAVIPRRGDVSSHPKIVLVLALVLD